jgi:hypothetical protein
VTCRRWEISTTTVSSSFGRGCFHGSPSTLMNVWSAAPLWNSNRILWACETGWWNQIDLGGETSPFQSVPRNQNGISTLSSRFCDVGFPFFSQKRCRISIRRNT